MEFKSVLSWFPNESSLFGLLNAVVLLFLFYLIKHDVDSAGIVLLVLIGLNLFFGLSNHDFVLKEVVD